MRIAIMVLAGIAFLASCPVARAGDEPFTYPSSWGGAGLMEIPTARTLGENRWRIGISQVDPARTYYGVVSPLSGLEIDGRVTEILDTSAGVDQGDFEGYGNFKDKSVDFKYQLLSEGTYLPAVALGVMDPSGTRLLASQYLVLSKQIYPFDFTFGLGNGRFGKEPLLPSGDGVEIEMFKNPRKWWDDARPFAGVQFAPTDRLAVMVEYAPIKYEKMSNLYDVGRDEPYFDEPVPSKVNVGVRWKVLDWVEVDLSWERGQQFGANVAFEFGIGRPLIPIYDRPYREAEAMKADPCEERLRTALAASGFSDIGVSVSGDELRVTARNDRYFYNARAIGVALRVVDEVAPVSVKNVSVTLTETRVPVLELTLLRSDIGQWREEKLTSGQLVSISKLSTDSTDAGEVPEESLKEVRYGLLPSFQTFLNDPSGFFKARIGVQAWASWHPWQGVSFVAGLEGYAINDISTANEPLSIPVRSDIALYKGKDAALGRLMADQVVKFSHGVYGRLSAGYLEIEYAGLDAELAMPVMDGRFLLGVSGSTVKKRDPDNPFKLKDHDVKDVYTTGFGNVRFNLPEWDAWLDVKAGRFLAGDTGARVTASKFIRGVTLSIWYGATNTSVFTDDENRGYHDKGFMVSVPLRLFRGQDTRSCFTYSLSPWTRDVGQDILHYNGLFEFIGRNTDQGFRRDLGEMQE